MTLPLIALQDRKAFLAQMPKETREQVELFHPDHFAKPLEQRLYDQIYNFYAVPAKDGVAVMKSYEADVTQAGVAHFENKLNSLVAESLAIRPGFSGSPLFAQIPAEKLENKNFLVNLMSPDSYYQSYLLGMLTKAEINGSRSLGISLPEILKILPDLLATTDASRDVYAERQGNGLQLKYKMTFDGQSLIRSQQMVYKGQLYSEICQDTTAESSEWDQQAAILESAAEAVRVNKDKTGANPVINVEIKRPSPKDYKDLKSNKTPGGVKGFQQKSGGGDYGEGGGGATLKNSTLMTPPTDRMVFGAHLTSYKRVSTCSRAAVLDSLGHSIDHLENNGLIYKVTNLAEAYDVYSAAAQGAPMCPTYNLEPVMNSTTYYIQNEKEYSYSRTEGLAYQNGKASKDQLQCIPNADLYHLTFSEEKKLSLDLILGAPAKSKGTMSFFGTAGTCDITITAKNVNQVNRWRYQIRTDKADVDVAVGTEGRLLTIKILRLAQECSAATDASFWMMEYNFSSPDQVMIASRPIGILRFAAKGVKNE